jgi:urease accessory protein
MRILLALATALTVFPTVAFAHPGGSSAFGFTNGFLHPLTGADHLAAAMLVGALAPLSRSAGSVMGAFLGAVAAGLLISVALPHAAAAAELGIAVGFAGLAAALLLRRSGAWLLSLAAAATGLAHGLVHGSSGAGGIAFAAGVLPASAMLVGAGYLVARLLARRRRTSGLARS